MKPGIPESFKVVVSELQSLGLQMDLKKNAEDVTIDEGGERVMLADSDEDDWAEDTSDMDEEDIFGEGSDEDEEDEDLDSSDEE